MRKKYAKQRASRKAKRQGKVTGHMTVTDGTTRHEAQRVAVYVGDLYDQQRQLPNGWRSCTELGNHYKAAKQAARYMRSK
tara:strand:+ start:169 stop:408 length:240 start_codon:yes stop_codon:yes gene_type:complete